MTVWGRREWHVGFPTTTFSRWNWGPMASYCPFNSEMITSNRENSSAFSTATAVTLRLTLPTLLLFYSIYFLFFSFLFFLFFISFFLSFSVFVLLLSSLLFFFLFFFPPFDCCYSAATWNISIPIIIHALPIFSRRVSQLFRCFFYRRIKPEIQWFQNEINTFYRIENLKTNSQFQSILKKKITISINI